MNWIKKKFKSWLQTQCIEALNDCEQSDGPASAPVGYVNSKDDIIDHRKSYTVKMQPANGGTVIEVSHYNDRSGDWNRDLFIVTDVTDLGSEISKILVQYKLTHN